MEITQSREQATTTRTSAAGVLANVCASCRMRGAQAQNASTVSMLAAVITSLSEACSIDPVQEAIALITGLTADLVQTELGVADSVMVNERNIEGMVRHKSLVLGDGKPTSMSQTMWEDYSQLKLEEWRALCTGVQQALEVLTNVVTMAADDDGGEGMFQTEYKEAYALERNAIVCELVKCKVAEKLLKLLSCGAVAPKCPLNVCVKTEKETWVDVDVKAFPTYLEVSSAKVLSVLDTRHAICIVNEVRRTAANCAANLLLHLPADILPDGLVDDMINLR